MRAKRLLLPAPFAPVTPIFCPLKNRRLARSNKRLAPRRSVTSRRLIIGLFGGARGQKGNGVDDGARTHDNRNHNPGLYQLSYVHQRKQLDPNGHAQNWHARQESNL